MSICHSDQRYYRGLRPVEILKKKLPMSLIHECCGDVVFDDTNVLKPGQHVIMIPNILASNPLSEIFENYQTGSGFLSSGYDGFMQELVALKPDRVIPFEFEEEHVACICELISVAVHAIIRFSGSAHKYRKKIGIWGDGSVAYLLALTFKNMIPESEIIIVGKHYEKLAMFSFAENIYLINEIPNNLEIDHAFECVGGTGSAYAIEDMIRFIRPQGTIVLLGVSEEKPAINTRDVLEKGLTIIGASRSGSRDFIQAVKLLEKKNFRERVANIIFVDKPVKSIKDIHKVFEKDLSTPFKTAFKWEL
jgi:ribitol-5-phosphate 2-dehydrogenase